MKLKVTKGQDIIKILHDEFADCLILEKPVALNWPDCGGTIGQYFVLSDYPVDMRNTITYYINDVLISGTDEAILEAMKTFLDLFENGVYDIGIYNFKHTADFHSDADTRENGIKSEWFYPEDFSLTFIQFNTMK